MKLSRSAGACAIILSGTLVSAQDASNRVGEETWLPSLVTATPADGFDLAIVLARKAVTTTQPDVEVLHALRPNYARDPQSLINLSGVVAAYFATIADANDHWRN